MPPPESFYIRKIANSGEVVFVRAKFLKVEGVLILDSNRNNIELKGKPDKYYPRDAVIFLNKSENSQQITNSSGYIIVPYDYKIQPVLQYSARLYSRLTKLPSLDFFDPFVLR